MSSSETRQHASGASNSPQPPEPSYAERVRTLLSTASTATLSTMSRRHAGFPFGSLMPFALDDAGQILFLISSMAVHTQNLSSDPRCSLFVAQENTEGDPLGAARATLLGSCEPVPSEDVAFVRETYAALRNQRVPDSVRCDRQEVGALFRVGFSRRWRLCSTYRARVKPSCDQGAVAA